MQLKHEKENVIAANVNMNEKRPHLHLKIIPIVLDKNGEEKNCCKNVLTKSYINTLHTDSAQYMNVKFSHIYNKNEPQDWTRFVMNRKYNEELMEYF